MEGLKLVVTADVKQAQKGLKDFVSDAGSSGKAAGTALSSGLNRANTALARLPKSSNAATLSLINLGRVAQDAPFGFLGIANNLNPLLESFQRLKAESGSSKTALKSLVSSLTGAGGIGLALSVASSLLIVFGDRIFGASKKVKDAEDANKKYKDSVDGIFSGLAKEATEAGSLIAVLKSETETRERKLQAIKELQRIQPEIFANLKLEGNTVLGLDAAYKNYLANLSTVIAVKVKQLQLEAKITEQLKRQGATLTKSEKDAVTILKNARAAADSARRGQAGGEDPLAPLLDQMLANTKAQDKLIADDIQSLFKDIQELSKGVSIADFKDPKAKKLADDIIAQAKRLAAFLDKNTQFEVIFEVDETKSEEVNKQAARDFIAKAKSFIEKQTPEFKFKPLLLMDFELKINQKFLEALPNGTRDPTVLKSFNTIKEEFEKNINDLAKRNPVLILFDTIQKAKDPFIKNQGEIASGIGLKIPGVNEAVSTLTAVQKESIAAAQTLTSVLTPAFQGLFSAIKAGENPLKAFFDGIGQAVEQLIQKLIAAAVQALILSAIFPGGVGGVKGFGGIFKNILGFASGGLVSGPQLALIGEGSGTSRNNPEVVAPLDQLRGMLAGLAPQQQNNGRLTASIRGNTILLSNNRTNRRNRRLGAR